MATIKPTLTELPNAGPEEAWLATWANMANGDDGEPIDLFGYRDRSVQVRGTFGAAGNCRIEGGNDGTNYSALRDPSSTALNITAENVLGVLEATRKIRPRITAGDGTTSLTVSMFFGRTKR